MDRALDRIIVYLGQTRQDGLNFSRSLPASQRELHAFSDADWNVTHSTSGWVVMLGGSAIAYGSKRQHSVALSSTEAEIMAASLAAAEIVHLRGVLLEMGYDVRRLTPLYIDNSGGMQLSKDLKSCQRSRHIERRYLRLREWVAEGQIDVRFVGTKANIADALTKSLDSATFNRHRNVLMGVGATPIASATSIDHASFDTEAAYLKGEFEKGDVWHVRPPPGYRHYVRGVPVVWRLKIPLYGEADAGRIWNRTLVKQLQLQGLTQSQYDPCYYRKFKKNGGRVDLLMYVDVGYVVTDDKSMADDELSTLHAKFKLSRKGPEYFLGNNVRVWD